MYLQSIELRAKEKIEREAKDAIELFINTLVSNGQMIDEYILAKTEQGYCAYVNTPKPDSLDARHDSIYGKKRREDVLRFFTMQVQPFGQDAYGDAYCECTHRSAMEMQTFAHDVDSVFTCCDCGKPIALYELPYMQTQDDHWRIISWQSTYGATDTLWLDSLSDRFTRNQLTNPDSVLNRMGRELAREMEKASACKVYYNIFDDMTRKIKCTHVDGQRVRVCPSCGEPMRYVKFAEDYERNLCDACGLSSDLPTEDKYRL